MSSSFSSPAVPLRRVERHADGVYHDMPEAEYRADPALSQSLLREFGRSPAHFLAAITQPPSEPTDEQVFGRVVHAMVLAPATVDQFAIRPTDIHPSSKEAREWREQHAAYTRVSQDTWTRAQNAVTQVRANDMANQALFSGHGEVSLFWTTPNLIRTKARVDWVPTGSNILMDLKTARSAEPEAYRRAAIQHDYPVQAAVYMMLYNALCPDDRREVFMHVVVETEPPFVAQTYLFSPAFLDRAKLIFVRRLTRYMECLNTNHWPGYADECHVLEPPDSYGQKP